MEHWQKHTFKKNSEMMSKSCINNVIISSHLQGANIVSPVKALFLTFYIRVIVLSMLSFSLKLVLSCLKWQRLLSWLDINHIVIVLSLSIMVIKYSDVKDLNLLRKLASSIYLIKRFRKSWRNVSSLINK